MTQVDQLAQTPMFGALSRESIERLTHSAGECRVEAGKFFFHEGDAADGIYLLLEGEVECEHESPGGATHLRTLHTGDFFGELAMLDLGPRSAAVRALKDCHALRIDPAALLDLYQQAPDQFAILQMNLARELSRRLRDAPED